MARPFQILPVIKVKVFWTLAIVFLIWSARCQGQEPYPDCTDTRGDLILHFPNMGFPGITGDNLRIAFHPEITPNCNPNVLSKRDFDFYIIIPYDDCGTRNYFDSIRNQNCFENKIEYNYYVPATHAFQKREFPVMCCKPYAYKSINFTTNSSLVSSFDYQDEINFYKDETLTIRFDDSPHTVTIGTSVVVGITVKTESPSLFADGELKLVTTKCTLDPTGHPDVNKSITIIDDNCPVDSTMVTIAAINATANAFRLKVYKWFGYPVVYVSCHVRLCLSSEHDPLCDVSCPKSRRRRQIHNATQTTSVPNMTVTKPLILIDAD